MAAAAGGRFREAFAGAQTVAETPEEKAAQVESVGRHGLLHAEEGRRRFGCVPVARQRRVQSEELRGVAEVLHRERDDRGDRLGPVRPGRGEQVRRPVPPGRVRALFARRGPSADVRNVPRPEQTQVVREEGQLLPAHEPQISRSSRVFGMLLRFRISRDVRCKRTREIENSARQRFLKKIIYLLETRISVRLN